MLQMVENGEATPMAIGGEVPNEEQSKPAFMRRMYLQNLYRFFRLYSYRSEFINPFESSLAIIFSNKLFNGTPLEAHFPEVVSFLMKRKMQREAISVLQNISEQQRGFQYYLVMGQLRLAQKVNDGLSATACFKEALALEPDNEQALRGYARSLYSEQRYDEALDAFERLLSLKPDNRSIELNVAVCLIDLKRYDEALKLLYKLNYEEADDERVNRVLAWCLTLLGKYEQALKIYESLLASDKPSADDLLNNAFCLWFKKDVAGAENLFRRLLSQQADSEFSLENELLVVEHALLLEHGLTDIDIHLMLDLLAA
jgi:tetratricopeptide (TPR) repeat protein